MKKTYFCPNCHNTSHMITFEEKCCNCGHDVKEIEIKDSYSFDEMVELFRNLTGDIDDEYRGYTTNNTLGWDKIPEFIQDKFSKKEIEEETIPVTLFTIKKVCGWSEYCDVTGGNRYMLNEHSVPNSEIFHVKLSHAKKLGLY